MSSEPILEGREATVAIQGRGRGCGERQREHVMAIIARPSPVG